MNAKDYGTIEGVSDAREAIAGTGDGRALRHFSRGVRFWRR